MGSATAGFWGAQAASLSFAAACREVFDEDFDSA
jgi:hypothetical protein